MWHQTYWHYDWWWTGHGLFMLLGIPLILVPVALICRKAGFSGWLSLLVPIPLINLLLLYFLAFADWPALRERRHQDR